MKCDDKMTDVEKSELLLKGIRSQITGQELPPLKELSGAQLTVTVKDGLLNWAIVQGADCW